MFKFIRGLFSRDIAIDLGTANTLVYKQGEGIVFNEPTVVAMNASTGAVAAMGEEAWQMIGGRSGNVVAVRPLRHGVMTEFDITQRMIEVILRRVGVSRLPKPRVLACIASRAASRAVSQLTGCHCPSRLSIGVCSRSEASMP